MHSASLITGLNQSHPWVGGLQGHQTRSLDFTESEAVFDEADPSEAKLGSTELEQYLLEGRGERWKTVLWIVHATVLLVIGVVGEAIDCKVRQFVVHGSGS